MNASRRIGLAPLLAYWLGLSIIVAGVELASNAAQGPYQRLLPGA